MYQFIHIEDYSINASTKKADKKYNDETRGRSLREVIAEAKREEKNCPHVSAPEDPIILYGVSLDEVEKLANDYHQNTKTKDKNGKEKKLRKDANVILAGVVSISAENSNIWERYKLDAVDYLKEKYGDKLKCVAEHTDEANPHFHFYVIQTIGERFDLVHDGKKAAFENKDKLKGDQNNAYKDAMRRFQEDFFLNVSSKYGLTKDGPRRARLTRASYLKQKEEIKLLNTLKTNTKKEIEKQKARAKTEIDSLKKQELAIATKTGEKLGFQRAIREFENKNSFNKFVFSRIYSASQIEQLERRNTALLNKNKKLFERKELYKKQSIENNDYKNKFNYLKEVTQFINNFDFDFKENKDERSNDVRREITREIERIETQQQQVRARAETIRTRLNNSGRKIESVRERVQRTARVLLTNIHGFIGYFSGAASSKQEKLKINDNYENSIEKQQQPEPEERTNTKRRNFKM